MNSKPVRLGLAAIAAFYVVVGSLWALDYFPLQGFYKDIKLQESISEKVGFREAFSTPEYREAGARMDAYSLSHSGAEKKVALYGFILLWGTVALCTGGAVLIFTRSRDDQKTAVKAE